MGREMHFFTKFQDLVGGGLGIFILPPDSFKDDEAISMYLCNYSIIFKRLIRDAEFCILRKNTDREMKLGADQ